VTDDEGLIGKPHGKLLIFTLQVTVGGFGIDRGNALTELTVIVGAAIGTEISADMIAPGGEIVASVGGKDSTAENKEPLGGVVVIIRGPP